MVNLTIKMDDNEKKTGHNSTFAIGGVTCFYDTFVVKESSVLRINICAEKPAHRKSAKRWWQYKNNRIKNLKELWHYHL